MPIVSRLAHEQTPRATKFEYSKAFVSILRLAQHGRHFSPTHSRSTADLDSALEMFRVPSLAGLGNSITGDIALSALGALDRSSCARQALAMPPNASGACTIDKNCRNRNQSTRARARSIRSIDNSCQNSLAHLAAVRRLPNEPCVERSRAQGDSTGGSLQSGFRPELV